MGSEIKLNVKLKRNASDGEIEGEPFTKKTNSESVQSNFMPSDTQYKWMSASPKLQPLLNGKMTDAFVYLHTYCIKKQLRRPLYVAQDSPFGYGEVYFVKINNNTYPPGFGLTEKEAKMWAAIAALDQLLEQDDDQDGDQNEENEEEKNYVTVYLIDTERDKGDDVPLHTDPENILTRSDTVVKKVSKFLEHIKIDATTILDRYCLAKLSNVPEYIKRPSLFWGIYFDVKIGNIIYSCESFSKQRERARQHAAKITLEILLEKDQGFVALDFSTTVYNERVQSFYDKFACTNLHELSPKLNRLLKMFNNNSVHLLNMYCQKIGVSPPVFIQTQKPLGYSFIVKVGYNYYLCDKSDTSVKSAKLTAANWTLESIFSDDKMQLDSILTLESDETIDVDQSVDEKLKGLLNAFRNDAVSLLELYCIRYNLNTPNYVPREVLLGFAFDVNIGDNVYCSHVVAKNKRKAKHNAAIAALSKILPLNQLYASADANSVDENLLKALLFVKRTKIETNKVTSIVKSGLFEKVENLVSAKFQELLCPFNNSLINGPKVYAGFVLVDSLTDQMCTVAVATGNQTINGDTMRLNGTAVNDCHAEVLCRRCLLRFIYLHILTTDLNSPQFLFDKTSEGKFKLKERYSFHLFISTAPCGDARLFVIQEILQYEDVVVPADFHEPLYIDKHKTGLLRCKVEKAQGTLPASDMLWVQTLDGITGGERLFTMSCSDKLLKWNVLGLQGALLGRIVEPIYLSSITVGGLYHHGHMSRAVCCRVSNLTTLPHPYRVNHPALSHAGVAKWRNISSSKSKSITVAWNMAETERIDVLDGAAGITVLNEQSRFCKLEMFNLFKALKERFSHLNIEQLEYYSDAKIKNDTYQSAKMEFIKTLFNNEYGVWVKKPVEEKLFY